jgi:hypothetical protein
LEVIDYQRARKHIKEIGKEEEVKAIAKKLQKELSEGEYKLPYRDALVMATYDFIETRSSYF